MTRIHFIGPFGSTRLASVGVPVQIRTPELKLLRTVMSSDSVSLDPGKYVLTARLPAGQEIVRVVDASDAEQTVDLRVDAGEGEAQPLESVEVPAYFSQQRLPIPVRRRKVRRGAKRSAVRGGFEDFALASEGPETAASPQCVVRCFAGNPLKGALQPIASPAETLEQSASVLEYRIPGAPMTCFTQSVQPDLPPVNIALPIAPQRGCILLVHREPDRYWIEAHLENPDANLLLGYQQNRAMQEEAVTAEHLLRGKLEDPIAAAVGAYSLLRFGELERLHDWSANLMNLYPWLPDGAAIRGEHLARLGEHDDALKAFLEVESRGVPMFSSGIAFLNDRLRLYASMGSAPAKTLHARLSEFASYVDFQKVLTTFTGLDPSKPDNKPFKGDLPPGTDVAAAFEG